MSMNVISSEDIENYKQMLEKHKADNMAGVKHGNYYDGYSDAMTDAINVVEELDESQKVIIPQFVADWIKEAKVYSGNEVDPLGIIYFMGDYFSSTDPHYEWIYDIDNQKLLLNAIANGYEVEKEPKYYVKIKHFNSSDNILYVNHDNARGDFFIDNKKQSTSFNTIFTKSYLKHHWTGYEAYNNAGLLEFEEVEDD